MKIPERFIWAANVLDVRPEDQVLEIGCGVGLLVAEVAKRLEIGAVTALDKSGPMLEKARKRNQLKMEQGLVKFFHVSFKEFYGKTATFDKVVAFNVNFFWHNPATELKIIKSLLKPEGRLYVFHQSPFEIDKQAAGPVSDNLVANGFEVKDISFKKMHPTSAFCIIACPQKH